MPGAYEPLNEHQLINSLISRYSQVKSLVQLLTDLHAEHLADVSAEVVARDLSTLSTHDGVVSREAVQKAVDDLRSARPELFAPAPSRAQAASLGFKPEHQDPDVIRRQWVHAVHAARVAGNTKRASALMNCNGRAREDHFALGIGGSLRKVSK